MVSENELTRKDILIGFSMLTAMVGAVLGVVTAVGYRLDKEKEMSRQNRDSANRVVLGYAGEDRIWDMKEKREFLNDFGFYDVVLQESAEVVFRSHPYGVKVYLGNRVDNNGNIFRGSSAQSGEYIGFIKRETLEELTNTLE